MIRTGAEYIESLRDARTVFVDGERVADVTEHAAAPGLRMIVRRPYAETAPPTAGDHSGR